MKNLPFVVAITVSLLATACGTPATIQSIATPTSDNMDVINVDAIYTSAASTVAAQLTTVPLITTIPTSSTIE